MFARSLRLWSVQLPLMETATVSPGAGGGGTPTSSGAPSGGSPTSGTPSPGTPSGGSPQPAPGATGTSPASPANNGPVPYERFEEINNRLKGLTWAESYADNPERVQTAVQLWDWFDQDPEAAYEYLTSQLTRSGALKRQAPQQGQGRQQPQYPQDQSGRPLPDVVIQETGQKFYSAEQAERLLDWRLQQLDSRLAPLEGAISQSQNQQQARAMLAEAETWPYFNDFAEEIFKTMQKDRRLSLEGAYNRVALPKIRQKERESVIAEMQRQGNATTTNPQSARPSSPSEDSKKSLQQLFKEEMAKRGIGR